MRTFRAMNTTFNVIEVPLWETLWVRRDIIRIAKAFSRFRKNSELALLNSNAGKWVSVSKEFYELLALCNQYYHQTRGLFNPFMGLPLKTLGYNESFDVVKKRTADLQGHISHAANAMPLYSEQLNILSLNDLHHKVMLQNGYMLDVGGIAKGWSVQKTYEKLVQRGITSGIMDGGGDLIAWGKDHQSPWGIEIANPFNDYAATGVLWLRGLTAIATSSVLKRKWKVSESTVYHHIIDPRNGLSSTSDIAQATILAENLITAEVYAKCAIILGSEEGKEFLESAKLNLAGVLVKKNGNVITFGNLHHYCTESELNQNVCGSQ